MMKKLLCASLWLGVLVCPLGAKEEKAVTPVVAVYDIEGRLSESGQPEQGMFDVGFGGEMPMTHYDVVASLKAAAQDKAVKGVVVDVDQAGMGLAQIEEMRRALLAVRAAGKDVWVYSDRYSNGTALIGSAATKFGLMPEGNVNFSGLFSESMYFKGMLDKIGVRAQVVHIGDFKSFGEQFYRTGPSAPAQKQTDELLDGLFEVIVESVASGRKVKSEVVKGAIDDDLLEPQELVEKGLVDVLVHRTDFVKSIEAHYKDEVDFDWAYKMEDRSGPKIEGFMDLMKLMFQDGKKVGGGRPYIALVVLDGGIDDGSIAPVRQEVLRAAKDDKAKALVLRVNSPGGSALSSEVLWEALEEWKKTKRPFVVTMGGVAASGGYYVSAGADRIFAEKGTITGSIGVVGMKLVLGDAMAKMGISVHSDKRGKYADIQSTVQPFTAEQEGIVRRSMLNVYDVFLDHVAKGREGKLKKDVKELAGGRVYTGTQALKLGLVDEIGGLGEALAWVRKKADLKKTKVVLLPKPKSPLDGLFNTEEERHEDDELIEMAGAPEGTVAATLQSFLIEQGTLGLLSDGQREALQLALQQLRSAQRDGIQLVAPPLPLLRP